MHILNVSKTTTKAKCLSLQTSKHHLFKHFTRYIIFQQAKSHLLEISETLFQLNISLHNLSISPAWQQYCHSWVEAKLRETYTKWQHSHHLLAMEEAKHHEQDLQRQQGAFSNSLALRLQRLARTEEYVNTTSDYTASTEEETNPEAPSWWNKFIKYSLVSGVLIASLVSSSYFWSYNQCQQGYFSTIWPLLTYSSFGPRPF